MYVVKNYGECPPDYDQYFISQKLKYGVKTPSRHNIASIASFKRSGSFRFVYNYKFFYILRHLKFKPAEEKYQALVEFSSDVLSQLDSDQGTTRTIFFVPNSKQKYRGATMPQITVRAKEQWQQYLGDLSIIVSVRYHTHTHTHTHKKNTHARMRNQHQKKEKKKKVKDVKVKKKINK